MSPTYPCWLIFQTIYTANAFIKPACEVFYFLLFLFLFFFSFLGKKEKEKKSQIQLVADYLTRSDKC